MEERLRRLERTRHTDPGVEAQLLRTRMRSGDLLGEQVRLAAYLGHEPARAVCEDDVPAALSDGEAALFRLQAWVRGLQAFHPLAPARAAHTCVRLAIARWRDRRDADPARDQREAQVLDLFEAWIAEPSTARRQALSAGLNGSGAFAGLAADGPYDLGFACLVAATGWSRTKRARASLPTAAGNTAAMLEHVIGESEGAVAQIAELIAESLLPWALGSTSAWAVGQRRSPSAVPSLNPEHTEAKTPWVETGRFESAARLRLFGQDAAGRTVELGRTPGEAVDLRAYTRWWIRPSGVRALVKPTADWAGTPGLWLRGLKVRDEHLAGLIGFPNLRWLSLRKCVLMSDVGLEHVANATALEQLDLWGCVGIGGSGLKRCAALKQLRDLSLTRTRLSTAGWLALADLNSLERLDLAHCATLSSTDLASALANKDRLRSLDVTGARGVDEDALRSIGACRSLTHLDLTQTAVRDEGLRHLAGLQLESLLLRGTQVKGPGLAHLVASPGLRRLTLANCPLQADAALDALASLIHLSELDLRGPSEQIYRQAKERLSRPGLTIRVGDVGA